MGFKEILKDLINFGFRLRSPDYNRGAIFASLEKYASHFSNSAYGGTAPNNAPYTGTDINLEHEPELSLCAGANTF